MSTLEQRVATRLREVLDHQERTRISAPPRSAAWAVRRPRRAEIVLTVEDVARIAAVVADLHG